VEGKDELRSQKVEKAFPDGRRCREGSSCISAEIVERAKEMLDEQREQGSSVRPLQSYYYFLISSAFLVL